MNRVAGIVRTHLTDKWSWTIIPWVILASSFVCNLIIGGLSNDKIYTGGLASIFVYMLVLGIVSVGQTFPFLIGLSVRRKDYFLGTTATIAIISVISAIVLILIGFIEQQSNQWGVGLYFFKVPYLTDGPLLEQFWILFNLMINLFFCGFIISSIHRRFGRNGLYLFFIILSVVLTVSIYLISLYEKWNELFEWFADISVIELASGVFMLTLIYIGISYLLLRRASI